MRALAFVIFAACAGAPTVPAAPAAPHYRTVHIDTLAPDKAAQFEGARRAWVAELHSHGASDQRGRFFEVVGVGFLTIRPFSKFADLDARGASRKAALANVPADALARYDKLSDESLAFPHASEVWEPDTDFAFGSLDETTAGAIEMIVEDVRPDTASERDQARARRRALPAIARDVPSRLRQRPARHDVAREVTRRARGGTAPARRRRQAARR
jgi:hypothetical protein